MTWMKIEHMEPVMKPKRWLGWKLNTWSQSWNQKDDMDELNTWIEAWNEDENYDMDETKTHGLNHETEAEVDDMDEIEWKDMMTLAGQVLSLWYGGEKPQCVCV